LWQNRGTWSFLKREIQQNQGLTSLGSKLLDYYTFYVSNIICFSIDARNWFISLKEKTQIRNKKATN